MGGKQTKRERRRQVVETRSEVLDDRELGVRVELTARGGYLVQWRSGTSSIDQLLGIERVRTALDDIEREVVLACRIAEGYSWEELGWCLGLTAEAVRRRYAGAERDLLAAVAEAGEKR
jgi:DNA-directed RNA polymerase specialized sigma24 family protein